MKYNGLSRLKEKNIGVLNICFFEVGLIWERMSL